MSSPNQPSPGDEQLEEALLEDRPVPRPGFRSALGQRLALDDPGYGPRPEQLWFQVLALVCAGAILLLIGALIGTGSL